MITSEEDFYVIQLLLRTDELWQIRKLFHSAKVYVMIRDSLNLKTTYKIMGIHETSHSHVGSSNYYMD
jgi:hypothetical protein